MPDEALEKAFAAFVGVEFGPPDVGRDAVNEPMIRQWCDAMGDRNPVYVDPEAAGGSAHGHVVAPPTMLMAWTLGGFDMADANRPPENRQQELHALFEEHGYSGVVATNCEQEYVRYLEPGDVVSSQGVIESISEEKATALGIGHFIVTRTSFRDAKDGRGDRSRWCSGCCVSSLRKPSRRPQTRRRRTRRFRSASLRLRGHGQRLVVGGHRSWRADDPEVQRLRNAGAPSAAADVPRVPLPASGRTQPVAAAPAVGAQPRGDAPPADARATTSRSPWA